MVIFNFKNHENCIILNDSTRTTHERTADKSNSSGTIKNKHAVYNPLICH